MNNTDLVLATTVKLNIGPSVSQIIIRTFTALGPDTGLEVLLSKSVDR